MDSNQVLDMIAQNIKDARASAKKTQKDVADFCKVQRTSVANWESGVACPPLPTLVLFCQCVGTTPNKILGF